MDHLQQTLTPPAPSRVPLHWRQHQRAGAEASGIPSRRPAISGRGEITNGNIWEMLAYND